MIPGTVALRALVDRTVTSAGRSRCWGVRSFAFDVESSDLRWAAPLRNHIDACLTCQAELVRARHTLRELRDLPPLTAPPGVVDIAFEHIPRERRDTSSGVLSTAALASVSAAAMGVAVYLGRRLLSAGA